MSKWYEVKITTVKILVVEVRDTENEGAAIHIAGCEAPFGGNSEYEALPLPVIGIERCMYHADIVRTLDGKDDKG